MDMGQVVAVLAMLLAVMLGAAFLLLRHRQQRRFSAEDLSPVTRQHIELFQGAQLSEAAVESTKVRLRSLLERGEVEAVEARLRPGTHYVVQGRALAQLGSDDAGRILQPQPPRRPPHDQIEQARALAEPASH